MEDVGPNSLRVHRDFLSDNGGRVNLYGHFRGCEGNVSGGSASFPLRANVLRTFHNARNLHVRNDVDGGACSGSDSSCRTSVSCSLHRKR